MKQLLLFLTLSIGFNLFGQVTNEGQPLSWKLLNKNETSIKAITLPSFDLEAVKAEDEINDNTAKPWRFGYMHSVDYGLEHGAWTDLENGDRIWRIKFNSPGALSLNVIFDNFNLPEGGKVYLYNDERTDLLGAYTNVQNQESGVLGTWLVKGQTLWVDYYEPANVVGQGSLRIKKVTHGYRNAESFKAAKALNDSGACNLDVDCPVGSDWETNKEHNKKAVGILLSGGSGFCTGALINNTANDGTPYFLTANHCFSNPDAWAFRFGWISPDPVCAETTASTNGPTNMTISGATLRARNANSDVCLVEINSAIPTEWNRTWSGWNRTGDTPNYVAGIHHPRGDIMKVCRDDSGVIQAPNAGAQTWEITTAGGGWELGVTEPGSSGSPLYDDQGNIIGQLFGGGAACSGTVDNGLFDYYGRFDVSWDAGADSTSRLKDWLDPSDSGVSVTGPFPSLETFNIDATVSITVPDIECGVNDVSPYITLTNFGLDNLTSATIVWNLDGGGDTEIDFTGSLAQYESEQFDLGTMTVSSGSHTFNVSVSNPNGATDENNTNDSSSTSFEIEEFETLQVHLDLLTDDWAEETTWEFKDASGTVLYSGGPYQQNTDDNTHFLEDFDVTLGECYSFVINDTAGDGICCGFGLGSYELTTDDDTVIFSGGSFAESEETEMSIREALSTEGFSLSELISLYPNPTNQGVLNIKLNNNKDLNFSLFNTTGQSVKSGVLQSGENRIDVSSLYSGFYFVKIKDNASNQEFVSKIVIN